MNNKINTYLEELINIDSPTGYTKNVTKYLEDKFNKLNLNHYYDNKGNIYVDFNINDNNYDLISSHVDTLGLMVKDINDDNTLSVAKLGGINISTLNGEYCKILTRDNKYITGTVMSKYSSTHVFKDANKKIEIDDLIVKLDSKLSPHELNITTGCYICIDPKLTFTNEFIKSRFLDDKLCVAISLYLIEEIINNNITLKNNTIFAFSTYEEVGHGMAFVNKNVNRFIAFDMACVGDKLDGNEHKVTICPMDSSGPYDYELTNDLINLAINNKLDYAIDIYPFYGSDGSAALRGGNDIKVALIGPGVANSHGVERSHNDGINNTVSLLKLFLEK